MHGINSIGTSCHTVVQSGVRCAARTRRSLELLPHILAADPEAKDSQRKAQHRQPARSIACSAAARLATRATTSSGPVHDPHLELTTSGRAPAHRNTFVLTYRYMLPSNTNSIQQPANVSAQASICMHLCISIRWRRTLEPATQAHQCQLTLQPNVRARSETSTVGPAVHAPHGVCHAHLSAEHLAVGVQRVALQDLLTTTAIASGPLPLYSCATEHNQGTISTALSVQEPVPASHCNVR